MNKKAMSGTVIIMIILLIFAGILIAIFFFPNALLPKIAETTKGFERFLPGRDQEEITSGLTTTEEIKKSFDDLYNAFINSRGKEDCYIEYTSLNMGNHKIELEYINEQKGTNMRLLNEKLQLVSTHFVNGIQPCIALPSPNDGITKVSPLIKADITDDNELVYGGNSYNMFGDYPLLYKPNGQNLACFFTDERVIDPVDGKVYGATWIQPDGFDNGDMKDRMNKKCK